jgi:hypothetical protein
MKKLNKLAAVAAVALGLGVIPQVHAIGYSPVGMELESGGRGDTLLFPMFYGYTENYFTISNSSNSFIQGHLRFRGAAWSGELLDFDVILTPGDVFVFRLADIDGDGFWEIDQSLDPNNFAYTGLLRNCTPEGGNGVGKSQCMDQYSTLIPSARCVSSDTIVHHRNMGYVEFIGEGVFDQMTHSTLFSLIEPANAGKLEASGQREIDNKLGASLWSWVMPTGVNNDLGTNATGTFHATRTASDVPNALSGSAFITPIGKSHGLAYNAEAIVNFRTDNFTHRIDNYTGLVGAVPRSGVILHNENAAAPTGQYAYVYGYKESGGYYNNAFESRISFNNTWGPTLADGDDYNPISDEYSRLSFLRIVSENVFDGNGGDDSFDHPSGFNVNNSLAEVEEAIRKSTLYPSPVDSFTTPNASSPRQLFTGVYFDNAVFDKACQGNKREGNTSCSNATLQSWYAAFFPTKFFYAEDANLWIGDDIPACEGTNATDKLLGDKGYLEAAVIHALAVSKPFNIQVWDITEQTPVESSVVCVNSPCIQPESAMTSEFPMGHELSVFNIKSMKDKFGKTGDHQSWDVGRVSLQVNPAANVCRSLAPQAPNCISTFPGLLYTFDIGSDGYFSHWRAMER